MIDRGAPISTASGDALLNASATARSATCASIAFVRLARCRLVSLGLRMGHLQGSRILRDCEGFDALADWIQESKRGIQGVLDIRFEPRPLLSRNIIRTSQDCPDLPEGGLMIEQYLVNRLRQFDRRVGRHRLARRFTMLNSH